MKKLLTLIILAVIVIGGFIILKNRNMASADVLTEPWIVIESDTVNKLDAEGNIERVLATGDEVPTGTTIQTDAEGVAVLYFPDGSQARLDPNTTLTVTEATYDPETDTLVARLAVESGKLWSNVISFVNPESTWEVETAHAVATVRGTAFGTDTNADSTAFIGSESAVAVFALDPETGEPILETETTITTDDAIELTTEDVRVLVEEKREIAKKRIENLTRERIDEWVERQRANDGPLGERFRELRERGLTPEEARVKIRTEIQERFAEQVETRREELRQTLEENTNTIRDRITNVIADALPMDEIRTRLTTHLTELGENSLAERVTNYSNEELLAQLKKYLGSDFQMIIKDPDLLRERLQQFINDNTNTADTEEKDTTRETQSAAPAPQPTGITLRTQTNLSQPIVEGTHVRLEAILKLDDDTTENVTSEVTWSVIGPIGSITSPGVFTAKLDPSVAELGESSGSITATWQKDLTAFLANTPIFKVILDIPDTSTQLQG